jgi:hypothetical protein
MQASFTEDSLSRVIKLETVGKERNQLIRATALAVRQLLQQKEINPTTRDLAAFCALTLAAIAETIDPSVEAWEKRGYWVKADRFRMEWLWAGQLAQVLHQALFEDDWQKVAQTAVQVAQKLADVKVPQRHHLGTPWTGAFERLK